MSALLARVLFDEAHSEAWTIRPELAHRDAAGASRPTPPTPWPQRLWLSATSRSRANGDAAADAPRRSTACDVLVIAHPSDPRWERTTGSGSPRLSAEEIDAIDAFVRGGGGLIVLGETEQEKYGNNLNDLLGAVRPASRERHGPGLRAQPRCAQLDPRRAGRGRPRCDGDLLARVTAACLYRATTISTMGPTRPPPPNLPECSRAARDGLGARRRADRRRPSTVMAMSWCSPTRTCSAMTASASSTTARCG